MGFALTLHAITANGIDSDSVKEEFQEHAGDEQEHVAMVAERIDQLGGIPNFNPEGLTSGPVTQYSKVPISSTKFEKT
ncbi:MAG: ferritin-like domain-containing protein [Candidatus Tumulicola sp.]